MKTYSAATPSATAAADPTSSPTTRAIVWLASLALLGAVALLAFAGVACYETATYTPRGPNDDMNLVGVGYIVAIVLALPGALAVFLAAPALAMRSRAPHVALAMSITALLVIALVVVSGAYIYLPTR